MAAMVVGVATLVGSGRTPGNGFHRVRPMEPTTREFGGDALRREPVLDSFFDLMEGLVEGVDLICPYLA